MAYPPPFSFLFINLISLIYILMKACSQKHQDHLQSIEVLLARQQLMDCEFEQWGIVSKHTPETRAGEPPTMKNIFSADKEIFFFPHIRKSEAKGCGAFVDFFFSCITCCEEGPGESVSSVNSSYYLHLCVKKQTKVIYREPICSFPAR